VDTLGQRVIGVLLFLVVAGVVGLWHRHRSGRSRPVPDGERLSPAQLGAELGSSATLLQFSAPVCGPCRATRRVLSELAAQRPDVRHVELDAERHLDLVRRLNVLRTPTVLVLDRAGRVVARAGGVPDRGQLAKALAAG
jgi:thiol-disulfide isomerase/thioredoxin